MEPDATEAGKAVVTEKWKTISEEDWEQFKEAAKCLARLATFDGRVEALERACLNTPGVMPNRDPYARPSLRSSARYAEDILRTIRSVRHCLARGDAQCAASEAVVVGALAARAEVDFHWPEMEGWRAVLAGQKKARAKQSDKQRELLEAVRELRARHLGKYESGLAAATELIDSAPPDAEPWGYYIDPFDPETRRRAIDNLRKRIRRAERAATK